MSKTNTQKIYDKQSSNWVRNEPRSLSDFTGRPGVFEMLSDIDGKNILDLGCGEGYPARTMKKMGANKVFGIDLSQEMINRAIEQEALQPLGIEYVQGDVRNLNIESNSFDFATAIFLFNYVNIQDMTQVMAEAFKALRPQTIDGFKFITSTEFAQNENKFDLTVASAVLEHLPNMREIIFSLINSTNKLGYIYVRTPYEIPLTKIVKNYKIRWPRHLYDLGPDFWDQFSEIFSTPCKVLISRPSIVETSFKGNLVRTTAAYFLKFPATIESCTLKSWIGYNGIYWPFVGGWEAFIQISE